MNIFSKLQLRYLAWRDVRTDQFREAVHTRPDGTIDVFSVSPFVHQELTLYNSARARHYFHKRRFYLVRSKNGRFICLKFQCLNDSLAFVTTRISQIQARIRTHFADFNQEADILEDKRSRFSREDSPEYVQACQDEFHRIQRRFLKRVKPLYLANIDLVSNMLKYFSTVDTRLEKQLAKRHRRINLYYYYSSDDPKLPKIYYGYDRMAMIADTSNTDKYFGYQKEQLEEILRAYQEEYQYLFG